MKVRHSFEVWLLAITGIPFAVGVVDAVPSGPQEPRSVDTARSEAIVTRVCGTCHEWERIGDSRRTKAQWEELIDDMIGRGANGSEDDYKAILDYALRRYALVNINKAPSDEIAIVLGLSPKEADAIVAYRTAHGKIPDFDSLTKVSDVDQKKLEAARLSILY
jgi:competence ComEA-like helix-hairpin-helix protein